MIGTPKAKESPHDWLPPKDKTPDEVLTDWQKISMAMDFGAARETFRVRRRDASFSLWSSLIWTTIVGIAGAVQHDAVLGIIAAVGVLSAWLSDGSRRAAHEAFTWTDTWMTWLFGREVEPR